ncbi:MAG: carotenoid 1,2-hydratase [Saprospiraceae bacterium]|nr:carotenoid 1,2-hydratase [Pyrinomonadaceae bacterium]
MSERAIFNTFFDNAEKTAADFFEAVTEKLSGTADTLRDGTELNSVNLPRDLAAHSNAQTEWWYYTGHCETSSGRRFGFELVFFQRRTDLDKFSVVPLRLIGNPFYFAHFAVTDLKDKSFRYSHRKSSNGVFDYPASASEKHFYLQIGDWSARESNNLHILRATADSDITFEATLNPKKKVVLNGKEGVSFKDEGEASRYFSYTRMEVEGDLTKNGATEHFTGSAWMDREFGTWTPTDNQKGWDWFSIQLDNNSELMCYQLRNGAGAISPYSSGSFVNENSEVLTLTNDEFQIEPSGFWKSPHSGATYPSGWSIKIPTLEIDLQITPVLEDQELDTRGTTMIVYWEGACTVQGKVSGKNVRGQAYVELVGYDRSHDQPNLARFLMGNSLEFLTRLIIK